MARKQKPTKDGDKTNQPQATGETRRDEVGRSGVYPASGPLPPGDAEVKGMASWGQGERGAEGYNDSGTSEIWFTEAELREMGRGGVGRDQVTPGMDVFGSDGAVVGYVKDTRGNELLVARSMARDVFVPFAAVASCENNRLVLATAAEQVDRQGWETQDNP